MNVRQRAAAGVAAVAVVAGVVGYVTIGDDDSSAGNGDTTSSSTSTSSGDGDRTAPETLSIVGDSFIYQSRDALAERAGAAGLTADIRGIGGAAICNWDPQWEDIAEQEPDALVLSFAGNDIPDSCFNPTDTEYPPEQTAAHYREELDRILAMFPDDTETYVVLPPPIRDVPFEARATAMREMYRAAVDDHPGLRIIDVATTLDPEGAGFVADLPCESWEECPASGEITVRDPDGVHLTDAGAQRYARAVIGAIRD
jgi:lysophospholipase L1-like esterase